MNWPSAQVPGNNPCASDSLIMHTPGRPAPSAARKGLAERRGGGKQPCGERFVDDAPPRRAFAVGRVEGAPLEQRSPQQLEIIVADNPEARQRALRQRKDGSPADSVGRNRVDA